MHIMYSWLNILIYPTLPRVFTRIAFQFSRIRQNTRHGTLNNQNKSTKKKPQNSSNLKCSKSSQFQQIQLVQGTFLPSFTQNLPICQASDFQVHLVEGSLHLARPKKKLWLVVNRISDKDQKHLFPSMKLGCFQTWEAVSEGLWHFTGPNLFEGFQSNQLKTGSYRSGRHQLDISTFKTKETSNVQN